MVQPFEPAHTRVAQQFGRAVVQVFGIFELASRGRFWTNISTLGFAGYHGSLGESGSGSQALKKIAQRLERGCASVFHRA